MNQVNIILTKNLSF